MQNGWDREPFFNRHEVVVFDPAIYFKNISEIEIILYCILLFIYLFNKINKTLFTLFTINKKQIDFLTSQTPM